MNKTILLKKKKKKVMIVTNIKELVGKVLVIMKDHIGQDNKLSKNTLFKKVYGIDNTKISEMHEWIMWEMIKKAMHRCRQRTKCFIVSKAFPLSKFGRGIIWHYWVANEMTDFLIYRDNINRNIRAMKSMVAKCERSIKQNWCDMAWEY